MNVRTATAIAMAVTLVTVGLSAMPYAGASSVDCSSWDFQIADSENSASERTLLKGASEIGMIELTSLENNRELNIQFTDAGDDGVLKWSVYRDDGQCQAYTANNCGVDNTMIQEDTESCELEAPSLGTFTYFVLVEEDSDQNPIKYKPWHVEA